jgi:hypothetical protein
VPRTWSLGNRQDWGKSHAITRRVIEDPLALLALRSFGLEQLDIDQSDLRLNGFDQMPGLTELNVHGH